MSGALITLIVCGVINYILDMVLLRQCRSLVERTRRQRSQPLTALWLWRRLQPWEKALNEVSKYFDMHNKCIIPVFSIYSLFISLSISLLSSLHLSYQSIYLSLYLSFSLQQYWLLNIHTGCSKNIVRFKGLENFLKFE